MDEFKENKVVAAFTTEGGARIRRTSASGYYRLNPHRAQQADYIAFFQNRYTSDAMQAEWGPGLCSAEMPHGKAFMVAKIKDVTQIPPEGNQTVGRYVIQLSEYADLTGVPDWPGGRTAFRYFGRLADLGIDVSSLTWVPLPPTPSWMLTGGDEPIDEPIPSIAPEAVMNDARPPMTIDAYLEKVKIDLGRMMHMPPGRIKLSLQVNNI